MGVHHHHHQHQTVDSKDTASRAVTRAYSQTYQTYQYHLLVVAFVASLYGLYCQISNVYREYATRHSKPLHQPDMYFPSSIPSTTSSSALASAETKYTKSVFLPYVHRFGTKGVPLVWVTIHSGKEEVRIHMPVDTGSTGLLIGAPLLPGIDPQAGTRGRQYLSSSNIVYVGRYLDLNLTFHGVGDVSAEARVPVLIVDKSWVCPWYDPLKHGFECPLGPEGQEPVARDVSGITYMGVGFGRNKNSEGQRTATSWGNPFLNIDSVNGTRLGPADMKAGYIVSTEGIQLGLTRGNTRGFNFMRLERGVAHAVDARDWAMPRMQFRVNGRKSIPGFALIDTGIAHMYIRTEDSMPLPEVTVKNPKEGGTPTVHRVKNGTRIAIEFGACVGEEHSAELGEEASAELGEVAASYSFAVGQSSSSMVPSYVVPGRQEPPPYVNTGRAFLNGYSVAFDAIEGRLGFRPEQTFQSMI